MTPGAAAVNAPAVVLVVLLVVDFSSCFFSYGKAEREVHWLELWLQLYLTCLVLTNKKQVGYHLFPLLATVRK